MGSERSPMSSGAEAAAHRSRLETKRLVVSALAVRLVERQIVLVHRRVSHECLGCDETVGGDRLRSSRLLKKSSGARGEVCFIAGVEADLVREQELAARADPHGCQGLD